MLTNKRYKYRKCRNLYQGRRPQHWMKGKSESSYHSLRRRQVLKLCDKGTLVEVAKRLYADETNDRLKALIHKVQTEKGFDFLAMQEVCVSSWPVLKRWVGGSLHFIVLLIISQEPWFVGWVLVENCVDGRSALEDEDWKLWMENHDRKWGICWSSDNVGSC